MPDPTKSIDDFYGTLFEKSTKECLDRIENRVVLHGWPNELKFEVAKMHLKEAVKN